DVFLYDRLTGTNTLVSHSATNPVQGSNRNAQASVVSGDGRIVFYWSYATDLVPGYIPYRFVSESDTVGVSFGDGYLFDRLTGKSTLVTHAADNPLRAGNLGINGLAINGNGAVAMYVSRTGYLVADDANTFADGFAYITPPPTIISMKVADGSGQRSVVRSLTVSFDQPVMFAGDPAGAFVVRRGSETVALSAAVTTGTGTTVTLTFSGPGTQFGSLVDGRYTLTVLSSQVLGIEALDGDADGLAGGDYVANFHRLFGDANGDARVDAVDFLAFRLGLGLNNPAFDFDGDGIVGPSDFLQFRLRFLQSV
ncbi:MAG: hypothetical protein K1X57_20490, partial [Gemmataceae bacterium]|nr:hypothetical protein [Gemmataceae bacterium]